MGSTDLDEAEEIEECDFSTGTETEVYISYREEV